MKNLLLALSLSLLLLTACTSTTVIREIPTCPNTGQVYFVERLTSMSPNSLLGQWVINNKPITILRIDKLAKGILVTACHPAQVVETKP